MAKKDENTPVYFKSLTVENVLCFSKRQTLDLTNEDGNPAQWTVILGDNGTGKTTLLRSLAAMEPYPLRRPGYSRGIMVGLRLHGLRASRSWPELLSQIDSTETTPNIESVITSREKTYGLSSGRGIDVKEKSSFFLRSGRAEEIPEVFSDVFPFTAFLCYGYGANRKLGRTQISKGLNQDRSATLFDEEATLINAEEWLLQADYAALRSKSSKKKRESDQIKEILKEILPEVEDVRISTSKEDIPRVEFRTPYGWVPLHGLGLGYKTVIAWMVDLAARLFDRYPSSDDPLSEPAIVLVDEIDLHLHPRWQRTIMSFLTERFPNTQFIVTAHSPLVVQAAADANLVLLRREGDHVVIDNNPGVIENWRVDQVLTSIFELPSARPPQLDKLLERRKEILTKSRLTDADERELDELEAKIGRMPTAESPEDIRAMDIIRRAAEILGDI